MIEFLIIYLILNIVMILICIADYFVERFCVNKNETDCKSSKKSNKKAS